MDNFCPSDESLQGRVRPRKACSNITTGMQGNRDARSTPTGPGPTWAPPGPAETAGASGAFSPESSEKTKSHLPTQGISLNVTAGMQGGRLAVRLAGRPTGRRPVAVSQLGQQPERSSQFAVNCEPPG